MWLTNEFLYVYVICYFSVYIYTLLGASIFADRPAVHAVLPAQAGSGGSYLDFCGDHRLVAGVQ